MAIEADVDMNAEVEVDAEVAVEADVEVEADGQGRCQVELVEVDVKVERTPATTGNSSISDYSNSRGLGCREACPM